MAESFTENPRPHHVMHPELGWLTHAHRKHPELAPFIGHDEFVGGPPDLDEAALPYDQEQHVPTQMLGLTRLDQAELDRRRAEDEKMRAFEEAEERKREAERDVVRAWAEKDPAHAAIAKLLGVLPRD